MTPDIPLPKAFRRQAMENLPAAACLGEALLSSPRGVRISLLRRLAAVFAAGILMACLALHAICAASAQESVPESLETRAPLIHGGGSESSPAFPQKRLSTVIVDNYYPYTFMNRENVPDGFSVDLVKAAAKVMGLEIDIRVDTWERAMAALQSGRIDLLPMMAYSRKRDKIFDFSEPHTISYDAIFVPKGRPHFKSLMELKGKKVIVMKDDVGQDFLISKGFSTPSDLILTESLPESLRLLALGKGDAALMPKLVGLIHMKKLGLSNLDESPETIDDYKRSFSFAVREGDKELLDRLSQGLSIVKATGEYDQIHRKWFGIVEPEVVTLRSALKFILPGLAVILVLALALALWSISLKRLVSMRTAELELEIAERKRTEEELRASEARLALAVSVASMGVWDLDVNRTNLSWDDHMREIYGISREDPVSHAEWAGRVVPEDLPRAEATLQAAIAGRRRESVEFRIVRPDGSLRHIHAALKAIQDGPGGVHKIVGVNFDITRRKRMEAEREKLIEELQGSEERYRSVFENSFDGILLTVPDGRILRANPAACRIFGMTEAEICGEGRSALVDPEDPAVAEALQERAAAGKTLAVFTHIRNDGTKFPAEISSVVFTDKSGEERACTIIRDISARKRAEEEQAELIAELQNALAKVKLLSGFLPICASCKRIRDDSGYWQRIEKYIEEHSDAEFSHGICPECARKLYPEMYR